MLGHMIWDTKENELGGTFNLNLALSNLTRERQGGELAAVEAR
jgi:hypothetical protein